MASRLRLRIAWGFAAVFALSLSALAVISVTYLWRESERRLDHRLERVATGVGDGVLRELDEFPDSTITYAAHEVVYEWPANGDAFAVLDRAGTLLTALDRDSAARAIVPRVAALPRAPGIAVLDVRSGDTDLRAVVRAVDAPPRRGQPERHFTVVAFGSTMPIEEDVRVLGGALAVAAPLILLLSLIAGYFLAGRALSPVAALGRDIGGIAPNDLSRRVPVSGSNDEVDRLALEFNGMMARLDDAQRRNRGFVLEAAHQIRTPLTLVLGEAANALGKDPTDAASLRLALQRVGSAAEQMRRRVDELFLLAEAQSGEPVRLEDAVELDGLLLEVTDLMRGRASSLGRQLAIGEAEHVTVRGNAALLREAMLELIENGCRHSTAGATVTVSSRATATGARLTVVSPGEPFVLPPEARTDARIHGLGLPIVRWIAQAHGGSFAIAHIDGANVVQVELPRGPTP